MCLDALRSRRSRREEPLEAYVPDSEPPLSTYPAHVAVLADGVGQALIVVQETLAPAERLAFVPQPRAPHSDAGRARQRAVHAFLAASREGEFDALLVLRAPDVVLRADAAAVLARASPRVEGAVAVAQTFSGRARATRLALVDGVPGAVWAVGGKARVVFGFTIEGGLIHGIDLRAAAGDIGLVDVVLLQT